MSTMLSTPAEAARWLQRRVCGRLCTDSRAVGQGDGFVAWPGARVDARRFVADALARGASACLVEHAGQGAFSLAPSDRLASYTGLKAACGPIASSYYGAPSRELRLLAVTGTNGKTSVAWWLAAALESLADPALSPCALVGTLGAGLTSDLQPTGLTTPDPVLLQRRLREFSNAGVRSCAIEASSIGLAEHRLDGSAIAVAIFTNLSRDHLDYHGDMGAYWLAKRALFDWPGLQAAVINTDGARGAELAEHVAARGIDVWTVSLQQAARLRGSEPEATARGLRWRVRETGAELALEAPVVGRHNAANLMAVLGALRALGVPLARALDACRSLPPIPGRMERVEMPNAPLAIVDFAHTQDALAEVLRALRPLVQQRGGRLWCVFGCGGNRDRSKRPLMAAAAEQGADRVVLTSDNPRDEDPLAIIEDARAGLQRPQAALVQPDRALAIAEVLGRQAAEADVVLIAGKGHETQQEIAGQRMPFSDQAHARAALRQRMGAAA